MSIRVIIAGFKGKMGQAACQMVLADPDLDLVAVLDPFESESEWQGIPVFKDKADLAGFEADVWVDFTTPNVAYEIHILLLKWLCSSSWNNRFHK